MFVRRSQATVEAGGDPAHRPVLDHGRRRSELTRERTATLVAATSICLMGLILSVAGGSVADVLPARPAATFDAAATASPPALDEGAVTLRELADDPTGDVAAPERPGTGATTASATQRTDYPSGTVRAVIVGVNDARGSSKLRGAVRDAESMRDALLRNGAADGVTMLLDRAATRPAIMSALDDLRRVPADGIAVFAFSGHAHRSGGQHRIRAGDGQTISASAIASALRNVRARTFVILGACYAAGFDIPGITGIGRIAVFASADDELAYESSEFDRSFLFQYMVEEGMVRAKAQGPSIESAFRYAQRRLRDEYGDMVPVISDGISGDFVIGTPARAPTPSPKPSPKPSPAPDDDEDAVGSCGTMVRVGHCRD